VITLLDLAILLAFLGVQSYITVAAWRWAARRASGRVLWACRGGIVTLDAGLLCGYGLSLGEVTSRLHMQPDAAASFGAFAILYLLLVAGMLAGLLVSRLLHGQLEAATNPARRHALRLVGSGLMAAPFAVLGYGTLVARTSFGVTEVDVPIAGLHPDLEGLRILHLSDIHLSAFLSEAELARVIDASNELKPHLAVVTGDMISSYGDPLEVCLRQLSRLRSVAGTLGCLGNHERYAGVLDVATTMGLDLGIRFLRSSARTLRFGQSTLNLVGVDYQTMGKREDYLAGMDRFVAPGVTNILFSHNPDVLPVAARQGYDLMLSGHTHGGQVTVEILDQALNPARFFTPYTYGLYREGKMAAYVTRGIGTIGIPTRLGAPPEIALLRLRKA
jgi:uncharacterized protein